MMLLHQRLVLYLDLFQRRVRTEPHHLQCFPLGVEDLPRLGPCFAARSRAPPAAAVELGEHAERIGGSVEIGGGCTLALAATAIGAHPPGRTMAGQRILLIACNRLGIHAGKEIVGLVVFTNVIETEMEVFPRLIATLGRTVRAPALAAGPLAHDGFLARLRLLLRAQLVRLDANAVEEFR